MSRRESLKQRWRRRWEAQRQQRRMYFQIWLETAVVALTGRLLFERMVHAAIQDDWRMGTAWKLWVVLFLLGGFYALLVSIVARYNGPPRVLWLAAFGVGLGVAMFYETIHTWILLREIVITLVLTHLGWYISHSAIMQVLRFRSGSLHRT